MSRNYNVFLSWSGERSRLVADFLRTWLSSVVQATKPWMSESEIDKGTRWSSELTKTLDEVRIGIVCLTPENLTQPWLLFEAGALSKFIDERARLCTYLIGDLRSSEVLAPLGMFQDTKAIKEDTLRMVRTINRAVSDDPIGDESLEAVFGALWPKLEDRLSTLPAPTETAPAKRSPDEVMDEILELVRAAAIQRQKTQFMDAYIPTFQQFMPLLQQLVRNATRLPPNAARLRHPTDTSLLRASDASSVINTIQFPRTLQRAIPVGPPASGRYLDLVQMFGGSGSTPDGVYTQTRFTVKGLDLATGTEETHEITFTLDIPTARKIARYLEEGAADAERHHLRHMAEGVQQFHKIHGEITGYQKEHPDT
jgi:hypothetical protein